jgi:hypothetical protein
MKKRVLFSFCLSLTTLVIGSLGKLHFAIATPAPIFRPIVRDIENQLPRGMVIRLPAFTPSSTARLYPSIETAGNGKFSISLTDNPNCSAYACYAGWISVARSDLHDDKTMLQEARQQGTLVTLKSRIRGFYTYGISGYGIHRVIWEQDNFIFSVEFRGAIPRKQVIDTAVSMANEPLIRSSKQ